MGLDKNKAHKTNLIEAEAIVKLIWTKELIEVYW